MSLNKSLETLTHFSYSATLLSINIGAIQFLAHLSAYICLSETYENAPKVSVFEFIWNSQWILFSLKIKHSDALIFVVYTYHFWSAHTIFFFLSWNQKWKRQKYRENNSFLVVFPARWKWSILEITGDRPFPGDSNSSDTNPRCLVYLKQSFQSHPSLVSRPWTKPLAVQAIIHVFWQSSPSMWSYCPKAQTFSFQQICNGFS